MSEPLCLECLFKRGKRVTNKNLEDKYPYKCRDCAHSTILAECKDGCGKIMAFCEIMGYWQNGEQANRCMKFRRK